MLSLSINEGKGPIFLKDIARTEEISEKYLSQIIIPLKARGLVTTFRGAHGGYILSRPSKDITLRDIFEALEGDLTLVDCITSPEICGRNSKCITRGIWDDMGKVLSDFLATHNLADMAKEYKEKNATETNAGSYSI